MPILDGKSADTVIKGAIVLLGLIIVAITVMIVQDKTVPQEFTTIATALVGALAGFLTGTRVVPPDVSAQIKTEPITAMEAQSLAEKASRESK
jgi:hypothetical protein